MAVTVYQKRIAITMNTIQILILIMILKEKIQMKTVIPVRYLPQQSQHVHINRILDNQAEQSNTFFLAEPMDSGKSL